METDKKRKPGRPAKDHFEGYEFILNRAKALRDLIQSDMDVYETSVHECQSISKAFDELNSILPDKNSRILSDNAASRIYFAGTFYAEIMRDEFRYMLQGMNRLIYYLEVTTPQKEEKEEEV